MEGIIHSRLFLLTLTVAVYYGAYSLYKRAKTPLLNPLLVSIAVIIALLKVLEIDYAEYYDANSAINFMLGLSVIALAYPLEQNIRHIRGNMIPILASLFIGSIVAVLSVWGIAWLLGADRTIIASLQPKSVTTPIALSISESIGGIPALTSMAVVVAGVTGSVIGPWILKLCGIRDSVARGLAMGAASHAVGTAKALEMGAIEGALGGAAIGLMGLMTAVLIPVIGKVAEVV